MSEKHTVSRGFTIVEMIVVVVLLGVVAGIIAPRTLGRDRNSAKREAEALSRLCGSAARRLVLSTQRVALQRIQIDETDSSSATRFAVMTYQAESADQRRFQWKIDPMIDTVTLHTSVVTEVVRNARRIDDANWIFELDEGDASRPISIRLADKRRQDRVWEIRIRPGIASISFGPMQSGEVLGDPWIIDLDAKGLGDEPW